MILDRIFSGDQPVEFGAEVVGLFTDDFSIDELEKTWKEAAVTYFMILSQNLPGETEKNTETSIKTGSRFEH